MHKVDPTLRKYDPAIYAALLEYWAKFGKSPSQIELRDGILCSITTVVQGLKRLEAKGYITHVPNEPRSIQPTDWDLTLSKEPVDPWGTLRTVQFWLDHDFSKGQP